MQARVRRDPAFRQALLQEAMTAMLEGDLSAGKTILRDYINAMVGFEALGRAILGPLGTRVGGGNQPIKT